VCEGGYFAGDFTGGTVFDKQGGKLKEIQDGRKSQQVEVSHAANFIAAVRSRKAEALNAEAQVGHVSAACCHMANISYRIGKQSPPEAIRETIRANGELLDGFERCREYLKENGVDLGATPAVLGPWVTYDSKQERFVSEFADQANALLKREYREPFIVPKLA